MDIQTLVNTAILIVALPGNAVVWGICLWLIRDEHKRAKEA